MTATYVELELLQGNDEIVEHTVSTVTGPLDLTMASAIEMFIKPSKATADTDPSVTKLTLGGGITIVDASAGRCDAAVPAGALATAGVRWWRLDLVVSSDRKTAMFGPVLIRDL